MWVIISEYEIRFALSYHYVNTVPRYQLTTTVPPIISIGLIYLFFLTRSQLASAWQLSYELRPSPKEQFFRSAKAGHFH